MMVIVLIIVLGFQLYVLVKTILNINKFKTVFPESEKSYEFVTGTKAIHVPPVVDNNEIFASIARSINRYVMRNGNRANDYNLLHDIVERNCEAKEAEIHSQIPTTLYAGLMGTMAGIIIGIVDLINKDGGLQKMFDGEVSIEGIENLLSDVKWAMVASIFGILYTIILTFLFKDAKTKNANGKNVFLSWLQAELLPKMSSDVFVVLDQMSESFLKFNSQFSNNTQTLNDTLKLVNQTSENQARLMETINNLDVAEIAKANVKTFRALKDCTGEITCLAQMLHVSTEYLAEVNALNEKIDKAEQRTKLFEEMGIFFKQEISAIEERKKMLMKNIEEVDAMISNKLNDIAGEFESQTTNALSSISDKFAEQNQKISVALGEQERLMQSSEMSSIPTKIDILDAKIRSLESEFKKTENHILEKIHEGMIAKKSESVVSTNAIDAPAERNKIIHLLVLMLMTVEPVFQIFFSDNAIVKAGGVALLLIALSLFYLYFQKKK